MCSLSIFFRTMNVPMKEEIYCRLTFGLSPGSRLVPKRAFMEASFPRSCCC